jgi:hypothetical protein
MRAKCRFRRQASKPKQLVTTLHVPATEPTYRLAKTSSVFASNSRDSASVVRPAAIASSISHRSLNRRDKALRNGDVNRRVVVLNRSVQHDRAPCPTGGSASVSQPPTPGRAAAGDTSELTPYREVPLRLFRRRSTWAMAFRVCRTTSLDCSTAGSDRTSSSLSRPNSTRSHSGDQGEFPCAVADISRRHHSVLRTSFRVRNSDSTEWPARRSIGRLRQFECADRSGGFTRSAPYHPGAGGLVPR